MLFRFTLIILIPLFLSIPFFMSAATYGTNTYGSNSYGDSLQLTPTAPVSSGSSDESGGGGLISSDTTPPPTVLNIVAEGADTRIILTWKNPSSPDYIRTIVVRKEGVVAPLSVHDGTIVYEGTDLTFSDQNLDNNKTYSYSFFTIDRVPNYSQGISISIRPASGQKAESLVTTSLGITQGGTGQIRIFMLTQNLKQGMRHAEVKELQEALKALGFFPATQKTTEFFGPLTHQAVITFQNAYKNEILVPAGLLNGSGFVGTLTRKLILKKIALVAPLITSSTPTIEKTVSLTINLKQGTTHAQVKELQEALKLLGFFPSTQETTIYFGNITFQAVIAFQNAYKNEVLIPAGLSSGSGFVGMLTRNKLLLLTGGKVQIQIPAPGPMPAPTPLPSANMTGKYCFNRDIYFGISGDDVKNLQIVLNLEEIYPENNLSGYFGGGTKEAIIRFQEKYGIPALGGAGPNTRIKLNQLYCK